MIIGIWSGLGGIIQERILLSRLQIRRRMAIARTKQKLRKKRVDNEYIDKEIEAVEEAFKEKSAQLAHALKFSVGILEVSLLILGTFLWGFGDLFILWIAP